MRAYGRIRVSDTHIALQRRLGIFGKRLYLPIDAVTGWQVATVSYEFHAEVREVDRMLHLWAGDEIYTLYASQARNKFDDLLQHIRSLLPDREVRPPQA